MAENMDLNVNRDLIDPTFDGYKLSSEQLPVYEVEFKSGVDMAQPLDGDTFFNRLKVHASHNPFVMDPWNDSIAFFVDCAWNVCQFTLNPNLDNNLIGGISTVWTIPNLDKRITGGFNVVVKLCARERAIVTDGCGGLWILKTGPRNGGSLWEVLYADQLLKDKNCSRYEVLDAISYDYVEDGIELSKIVSVLLHHLDENGKEDGDGDYYHFLKSKAELKNHKIPRRNCSILELMTLSKSTNKESWTVSDTHTLVGCVPPDYAAIEPFAKGVWIICESEFFFVPTMDGKLKKNDFVWNQSDGFVTVWVPGVKENEIIFACSDTTNVTVGTSSNSISIELSNCIVQAKKLSGIVDGRIACLDNYQIISGDDIPEALRERSSAFLRITLEKEDKSFHWTWISASGQQEGTKLTDLKPLTKSDESVAQTDEKFEGEQKLVIPDQGQEVDDFEAREVKLFRLDAYSQEISNMVMANRWLFNLIRSETDMPMVCLATVDDGTIWRLVRDKNQGLSVTSQWALNHVGTYSGFSYISSSHKHAKFKVSPNDMSYAALCDSGHNVFIYSQKRPPETELRNRKTKNTLTHLYEFFVVSLKTDKILGAVATNKYAFVLTEQKIFAIKVKGILEDH